MGTEWKGPHVAVVREQGETFASFSTRQRAAQQEVKKPAAKPKRKRTTKKSQETFETRGDDLGESPDR